MTDLPRRIAIIGAGPIGIEAALYARVLGHDVMVYERGEVAENVNAWGFVSLFSPWEMNTTPLGWKKLRAAGEAFTPQDKVCPRGEELREHYLLPLVRLPLLKHSIRTHVRVMSIGRDDYAKSDAIGKPDRSASPFRILIREETGREKVEHADVVLDCSGTYQHHRWAGRGGIPAPGERALQSRIWYTLPDILGEHRARFADRHTLLLGAGYSAATVLNSFEKLNRDHPRTKLTWAIRRVGQALQGIHDDPLAARANLVKASIRLADDPPPWLQYLGNCVLERIEGDGKIGVTLKYVQTDLALAVDEVIAVVGYSPDASIYEQLQVHQCYATAGPMKLAAALLREGSADCLTAGAAIDAETLKNPEPDFYILGAKSFGTNSNFLLQIGHQQIRDVFRLIDGSSPDLYVQHETSRQS